MGRGGRLNPETKPHAYLCFLWKLHRNDGKTVLKGINTRQESSADERGRTF